MIFIVQVYIIGGDGTQKGAAVIYEVFLYSFNLVGFTCNLLRSLTNRRLNVELLLKTSCQDLQAMIMYLPTAI